MSLKFNIDRPKISDEEIDKQKDFNRLVDQFKQQSLKKAQGDESWWKNKKVQYSSIIAGITVVCTITYLALFTNQNKNNTKHETLITPKKQTISPNKQTDFIKQPSQKLKIPYTSYTVNNAKGASIKHTTSTKITIPKNAFIDKSGKDVIGDVTIEYKEMHDIGDVIVSGIPMKYDSSGNHFNLESAGMFDIKGSQNGVPVFIKPNKQLNIELASNTKENRFNQYYLDTIARNWKYIKKDEPKSTTLLNNSIKTKNQNFTAINSPKLQALKNQIDVIIPKRIDSVKIVCENKIAQLPKAKEPNKPNKAKSGTPSFKLDGSYDEFPELAAFENVVFEVGSENKNWSNDLHEVTWSDIKISQGPIKGKNYLLNLIYRNRSEKLIVYPVLSGADYDKAEKQYEQKLQNYTALLAKKQENEKRLISEMEAKQALYIAEQKKKEKEYESERAKLRAKYDVNEQNEIASTFKNMNSQTKATRLFKVSQFGVYNSDCPHAEPKGAITSPLFVLNQSAKFMTPDFIYLVDHTAQSVYILDKNDGFKMRYNLENTYSICIFSKNKLFLCSKQGFKQTIENESNRFILSPLPDNSENLIDFKKALEI